MQSNILKTPIDEIVNTIKDKKKQKISTLVNKYKVPLEYLERWFVILEERGVLKLTYDKFEGFVEYTEDLSKSQEETLDVDKLKEIFLKKSHGKKLSPRKTAELWKIFIKVYEEDIKKLFFDKAKARGFPDEKIENAWTLYRKNLNEL